MLIGFLIVLLHHEQEIIPGPEEFLVKGLSRFVVSGKGQDQVKIHLEMEHFYDLKGQWKDVLFQFSNFE